jgi:hypothetical protein
MKTDEATFYGACILTARVETNVPQGGDAGHGGKTTVSLSDAGGFAFGDGGVAEVDQTVRIEALGDSEAEVLANALIWAGERLHAMIGTTRREPGSDETNGA